MSALTFIGIIHIIGTALGVGGATVSDFLFLKAVRDGRIDKKEFGVLKSVSTVVWTGFAVLVFSGFGFFILFRLLPEHGSIYEPKLLIKLIVVSVIFFNGLLMHWKVFPVLKTSARKSIHSTETLGKLSLVLTTGAISITSWYAALILGAWRGLDAPFVTILGAYVLAVFGAIAIANIVGKKYVEKLPKK